jgi:hypothetical protein
VITIVGMETKKMDLMKKILDRARAITKRILN